MRLLSEVVAGRFRQFNPLISCRPVSSPGGPSHRKERLLRDTFQGAGFGPTGPPNRTVLSCCLTKLCIIPPSMAVKKRTVRRSLDLAGKAEGTMTKYWAFARGGAWRNPKTDRRPLRLRAMPPGRLRRKRRNPHHAGRHNNRAGPCGRVRRLRGAVVGGTGGPSPRVRAENVNSASPGSARSRPGREAAERTLDGADRFGIIRNEGKGDNSKGSQTGGGAAPSHIER